MNRKYRLYMTLLLCLSGLVLILYLCLYCHLNKNTETAPAHRITAILNSEDNLFWGGVWKNLRTTAAKCHLDISEYQLTLSESVNDYLEIALETGTDGIIFNPSSVFNDDTRKLLQKAHDAGMALISLDSRYSDVPAFYIGIDNAAASRSITDYITERIQDEHIFLISNYINYSNPLNIRFHTIQELLTASGYQNRMEILRLPQDNTEIREYLNQQLTDFDGSAYIVAIGPQQTLITARLLAQMDDSSRFHLIGFGETDEAFSLLDTEMIEALLVQDNSQLGTLAAEYMEKLLNGTVSVPGSASVSHTLRLKEES